MPNRLQLLTKVKTRCGIKNESQYDADILGYFEDCTREITSRYFWTFQIANEAVTTSPGTESYALSNQGTVVNVRDATNGHLLRPVDPLDFDRLYPDPDATGVPSLYRLLGQEKASSSAAGYPVLALYPVPAGAYALAVRLYADLPELSADTDVPAVPPRYHLLYVHYAAAAHFSSLGDSRSTEHSDRFENALSSMAEQLDATPVDHVHVLRSDDELTGSGMLRYPSDYPA